MTVADSTPAPSCCTHPAQIYISMSLQNENFEKQSSKFPTVITISKLLNIKKMLFTVANADNNILHSKHVHEYIM